MFCPYCGIKVSSKMGQSDSNPTTADIRLASVQGAVTRPTEATAVKVPERPSRSLSKTQKQSVSEPNAVPIVVPREIPAKTVVGPARESPDTNKVEKSDRSFVDLKSSELQAIVANPQKSSQPSKPGLSGTVKFFIAATLGLIGFVAFQNTPKKEQQECAAQLKAASQKFAEHDAIGAKANITLALASCTDDAHARAVNLQAEIDKNLSAKATCESGLKLIDAELKEHKLISANRSLATLPSECDSLPKAVELKKSIDELISKAEGEETKVEKMISVQNETEAQQALDRLVKLNLESPNIAKLQSQIDGIALKDGSDLDNAKGPREAPQPSPSLPKAVQKNAGQNDLILSFLNDAEQALRQSKFDAAKTYVESVRRIEPNNAQAAALARRIHDEEIEYMRRAMNIN